LANRYYHNAVGGLEKAPNPEFDYYAPYNADGSDGDIPLQYDRHDRPLQMLRPGEPPAPNSFLLRPPLIGGRHWTLHLANGDVVVTDLLTLRDERAVRKQCHWDALQIFPRQSPGDWRRELVASGYFELAGGPEREHVLVKKDVIPAGDLRPSQQRPTAGDIYDVLDAILDDVGENRAILAGKQSGTGILVARVSARLDA
jgi:hypothetical protein